jgi:hypothetical protein
MSTEQKFDLITVTAAQDLTVADCLYHAVSLAGTIVGSTSRVGGVLRTKCSSGSQASLVYQGLCKVMAGAAVTTLGYPLTVTASGWFIAASSGGSTIGRALAAAASGDLIPAMVDFNTIPAWPGT